MKQINDTLEQLKKTIGIADEKKLQEHLKKAYYEGVALVSDEVYDAAFPVDYVGYAPEQNGPWEVLEHKIEMGSLDKLKTWEQAEKWLKDKGEALWEPKLDGLSIALNYEYGALKSAVLRGGGDKGENILKNAINFDGVPKQIPTTSPYISVRGEAVISRTNFIKLQEQSGEAYKNRRNCISGICRRYDGNYTNLITFYSYDILNETCDYPNELLKVSAIHSLGFKVPFVSLSMSEESYNSYGDIRDTADNYQMDGLVIKTLDGQHAIALKFEPKGEITTVTEYSWNVGTTGKLVPKVHFETVNVGGSNLSQAAIGSYAGYIDLGAAIGSKVEVKKMGDVIPKVTKVIERPQHSYLEIPTCCPICESILVEEGTDLYCKNPDCLVKVKLKCSAVFGSLGIKGITPEWVNKLVDMGTIQYNYQVPLVTKEDIMSTGGYSEERAQWVIDTMKEKFGEILSGSKVANLLWMLPIPTISNAAYDKMAGEFATVGAFYEYLDGQQIEKDYWTKLLGNAKGEKVFEYLVDNNIQITKLLENLLKVVQ